MIALIFPGQGAQKVGMLSSFINAFSIGRDILDNIENATSIKISKIIELGSIEELTKTNNAQLAIFTVSMICLEILKKEYEFNIANNCKYMAGHSLGEISALCAAGAFTIEEGARIVKARGEAMAKACQDSSKFSMVALLGISIQDIKEIIKESTNEEFCYIANDNSSSQVVISGYKNAVDKKKKKIKKYFNKIKPVKLNTSGAFHTPLMRNAAIELKDFLINKNTVFSDLNIPVISNISAQAIINKNFIFNELINQITSKVRWRETIDIFVNDSEIDKIVEVAPGKILTSMIKNTSTKILSLDTINKIEEFVKGDVYE